LVGAESARRVDRKLQVESFKTREQAIERIREIRASLSIQPERAHDPEDPNADENGYVWVILVSLHKDAEPLYVCTDGCIR
jgi:flagellar basal body rod protein FlgC